MEIISAFLGALAGGCIGVVVTCLAVAAKRVDEQYGCFTEAGRYLPETKDLPVRVIQFINADGIPLFSIPDGDFVVLTMGNGESTVSLCQYLDTDHAEIDGVKWQLQKFAVEMEKRGISFAPPAIRGVERR